MNRVLSPDRLPSRQRRTSWPFILVLAALVSFSAPTCRAQNYLHTSGSKILDSHGNVVRLTGLNWFGLETANYCPHGLWTRSMASFLDQIKSLGYNCLRVPYCTELFDPGSVPNSIDYNQNPDLRGLTGFQILDKLVAGCRERGIKVILDRHRPDSGAQSPLWYTSGEYTEARWISDWRMLAQHYLGNDTVIGCDLHNEPHSPATWGSGNTSTDWRLAAERCGNAILSVNPHLLIIVEGTDSFDANGYWWGGKLAGAAPFPVQLSVPNQLVYSAHDYPSTVAQQSWFNDPTYPANLPSVWDQNWGYLVKNNTAPVLLGEFGSNLQTTSDVQWFSALCNYIKQNGLSFTFWCLNPNSGDTGGLLENDWQTVVAAKQQALAPLQAPFIESSTGSTTGGGTTIPSAPFGVSAAAGNMQVTLGWSSSAGATSYDIYRSTTSGGESSTPIASGITAVSYADTGLTNGTTYYYEVAAANSAGTSPASTEVSAVPKSSVTVPSPPSNLIASGGNAQVSLSWAASAGATSYDVFRSTSSGGETSTPISTGITSPSFTDTGLSNGATYYYKVAAANSAGASGLSNEASAKPSGGNGSGPATAGVSIPNSGPYYNEEDVVLSNTGTITSMTITINVAVTAGLSFNGAYNTVGTPISMGHSSTGSTLVYTYSLVAGQSLPPGSWTFAAQTNGTGTSHAFTGDSYTVTFASGGQSYTLSGTM